MHQHAVRWDAHSCPPFTIGADLTFLSRYKNAGVDFVSLNVGFDLTTQTETIKLLHYFHQWINERNTEYAIVNNVDQIIKNKAQKKLSIAFDIEGCNLLEDNLEMLSTFHSLGIKQIVFAYNTNNSSGGGCLDNDTGLTTFGKQLVKECNKIGIEIDCSHVGHQTSLDIIDQSDHPVVFSHSNPAALVDHPRNITDKQIRACAQKGGVIGINGIGIFLGNNDIQTQRIVDHIDYVAQVVGSEHVGIGLDCIFNMDEMNDFVTNNPKTFPSQHGFSNVAIAQPEQFSEIGELLEQRGYHQKDINSILGDNFLRVASTVWR